MMPRVSSYELKDVDRFFEDTEKGLRRAALRGLLSAAHRGVQTILVRIIPSRSPMPVDRGIYRAGWKAWATEDGAVIENLEPVAIFVEEGVRGSNVKIGRAMIQALAAWVVRKGIAGADEATGVAWAIAKRMQARGIFAGGQGFGILRELVDKDIEGFMVEEIEREVAKEFGA
jgi:hypothetical protein